MKIDAVLVRSEPPLRIQFYGFRLDVTINVLHSIPAAMAPSSVSHRAAAETTARCDSAIVYVGARTSPRTTAAAASDAFFLSRERQRIEIQCRTHFQLIFKQKQRNMVSPLFTSFFRSFHFHLSAARSLMAPFLRAKFNLRVRPIRSRDKSLSERQVTHMHNE